MRTSPLLSVALISALSMLAAAQGGSPVKTEATAPNAHDIAWRKLIANVRSQGKKEVDPQSGTVFYELKDTRKNSSGKTQLTYHIVLAEREKMANAQMTYTETDIGARFTLGFVFTTNASGLPTAIEQFHLEEQPDGSYVRKEDGGLQYDRDNQALFKSLIQHWAERKP